MRILFLCILAFHLIFTSNVYAQSTQRDATRNFLSRLRKGPATIALTENATLNVPRGTYYLLSGEILTSGIFPSQDFQYISDIFMTLPEDSLSYVIIDHQSDIAIFTLFAPIGYIRQDLALFNQIARSPEKFFPHVPMSSMTQVRPMVYDEATKSFSALFRSKGLFSSLDQRRLSLKATLGRKGILVTVVGSKEEGYFESLVNVAHINEGFRYSDFNAETDLVYDASPQQEENPGTSLTETSLSDDVSVSDQTDTRYMIIYVLLAAIIVCIAFGLYQFKKE